MPSNSHQSICLPVLKYLRPDTHTYNVMRHYRGPLGSGLTMMNTMEKCQETAWGQQGGKGLPYK
jgi:hypothetical protein